MPRFVCTKCGGRCAYYAQQCWKCYGRNRVGQQGRTIRFENYAGMVNMPNGRRSATYRMPCGHLSTNPHGKQCRKCYLKACPRRTNGGYPCRCVNGTRRMDHQVIAEAVLGRPLKVNEVVHHVDMDKTNNRHDNLVICSKKFHHELHHRMQLLWAENYKNAKRQRETA